jgi:hypothetical protein
MQPTTSRSKKRSKSEESLQIAISQYLRLQYPDVLFTAESSGIRLTMGQAVKAKKQRCGRGLPDMLILEPRGIFKGLMLELKREGERIWLRDGSLSSDKHIQEQKDIHDLLEVRGYKAEFCIGFASAKAIIDTYMKAPENYGSRFPK